MHIFTAALTACLLAFPAAAASPPAAVCLEVAKAGTIIEDQAEAVSPGSVDMALFDIANTEIRQWLMKRCYPDCEDMDALEGISSLMKITESCGGKE